MTRCGILGLRESCGYKRFLTTYLVWLMRFTHISFIARCGLLTLPYHWFGKTLFYQWIHVLRYILYFQVDYDTDELPDLPVSIDSLAALVSPSPSAALGSPATLDSPSPQTGLSTPEARISPAALTSLGSPATFGSSAHRQPLDLPQHLFIMHPSQPFVLRQPFVPRRPLVLLHPLYHWFSNSAYSSCIPDSIQYSNSH